MEGFGCCDGGYYISNEKSVNTDYYTMEEIEEELDEMEPAQNAEVEKLWMWKRNRKNICCVRIRNRHLGSHGYRG